MIEGIIIGFVIGIAFTVGSFWLFSEFVLPRLK
jgi:heme/copper-type cytochrome/quinol oxidase subunit 4